MSEKIEKLIRAVYKDWKGAQPAGEGCHPDEEALACFLEGRLSEEEASRIKTHLLACEACAEAVAFSLQAEGAPMREVPRELLERLNPVLHPDDKPSLLEIILKLRDKALEVISTTGDVLVGQELIPAAILRSRSIKEFKDEVIIMKDFEGIRVEAKIENKLGKAFSLIITARQKNTQKIIKDLRVTLMKDDLELESYLTDSGSVIFEHVLLGRYRIAITTLEKNLASVLLDIKV